MPVDTKHPEYTKWLPRWQRCRDVAEGEDAVKEAGTQYLPKLPGQSDKDYADYKKRALFFPATGRTVQGLRGLVFRKAPVSELPPKIAELAKDITQAGQSLEELAKHTTDEVITTARMGLLVEFPAPPEAEGELSQQDAERLGLRPYLAVYRPEDVINWRTERIGSAVVLSLVVLREDAPAPGRDAFSHDTEERLRVLDLVSTASGVDSSADSSAIVYRQREFRKAEAKGTDGGPAEEWQQVGPDVYPRMNGAPISYIPFRFVDPVDGTPAVKKPPILDLVNMNLSHYFTGAELEHGRLFAGSPTPVFCGTFLSEDGSDVAEVKLGAAEGVHLAAGGEAKYLEFTGQGLQSLETADHDKREMMAILGARILAPERRAVEAAETAAIHRASENSVLADIAGSVSSALTWCLEVMRDWLGESGEIVYELNTDYFPVPISGADLQAVVGAWQGGAMAYPDLVRVLKRGEVIDEDRSAEDILADIAAEGPRLGTIGEGLE